MHGVGHHPVDTGGVLGAGSPGDLGRKPAAVDTDFATASAAAWKQFRGVYGYYAVKGEKLGATVYGRFTDPQVTWGESRLQSTLISRS